MSVTDIEKAIQKLPRRELAKFRAWFAEFDAAQWDKQIEQDTAAGRLNAMANEAIQDLRSGHCKNL